MSGEWLYSNGAYVTAVDGTENMIKGCCTPQTVNLSSYTERHCGEQIFCPAKLVVILHLSQ